MQIEPCLLATPAVWPTTCYSGPGFGTSAVTHSVSWSFKFTGPFNTSSSQTDIAAVCCALSAPLSRVGVTPIQEVYYWPDKQVKTKVKSLKKKKKKTNAATTSKDWYAAIYYVFGLILL